MPRWDENRFRELMQDSLWWWVGLVFAVVVLAWVVLRLRQWFQEDSGPADDTRQLLSDVREMYHEGDLTEQEYRSIKGRIVEGTERASTDAGE